MRESPTFTKSMLLFKLIDSFPSDSKALFADTPPMTTIEKLEDAEDLYLTMT